MKTLDAARESELLLLLRDPATRAAANRELLEGLRQPVLALCLHLTRNRAQAEDATQETLLAVHQGLPRFRGESRLSTWVFRIAMRMSQKARVRHHQHEELAQEAADPAPSPEQHAAAQQQSRRLQAALEELSVEQRAVIGLFAVEGLRHAQIADVLGIPEGTVWSRLHLARKRLLGLLGGTHA